MYVFPWEEETYWSTVVTALSRDDEWTVEKLRATQFLLSGKSREAEFGLEKLGADVWKDDLQTVVPRMCRIAMDGPRLFRDAIPLLRKGEAATVVVSRDKVLCLMCNAFFCTLRDQSEKASFAFPVVPHFRSLFPCNTLMPFFQMYFREATREYESQALTQSCIVISRLRPTGELPAWAHMDDIPLLGVEAVHITEGEGIEDVEADGHANFANERLGGHIFGGAVAQEEILCGFRPELCVAIMMCERMGKDEVIVVTGAKKYSKPQGYGRSVEAIPLQPHDAPQPQVRILCMDAQYGATGRKPGEVDRDLVKAWLAFGGPGVRSVSTGRWGSGMFCKSPILTFLQQYLAASARRLQSFHYACFDSHAEAHHLRDFVSVASKEGKSVGFLYRLLLEWACAPFKIQATPATEWAWLSEQMMKHSK